LLKQIVVLGNATQAEVVRSFGISAISMKRYQERGPASFFEKSRGRGPGILTKDVLEKVQGMLDQGMEAPAIAEELNLKADTTNKAISDGRLHKAKKRLR
jgi:hypothetical protein